jgi:glucokinase
LFFNDLQPVARAIPALALTDFTTLRAGASVTGAARLAINVGTGFGAAVLQQTAPHECGGGFLSFPTEAGHMTLPHALALDAPEVKGLGATLEDILSGSGCATFRSIIIWQVQIIPQRKVRRPRRLPRFLILRRRTRSPHAAAICLVMGWVWPCVI